MSAFHHEKRGVMSPRRRAQVFASGDGRCAKCGRKLGPSDDWDIDHRIALECGGTDDDDNLQVLCDWCHDGKTAEDHGRASKGKRVATNHTVPKRFRQSTWRR